MKWCITLYIITIDIYIYVYKYFPIFLLKTGHVYTYIHTSVYLTPHTLPFPPPLSFPFLFLLYIYLSFPPASCPHSLSPSLFFLFFVLFLLPHSLFLSDIVSFFLLFLTFFLVPSRTPYFNFFFLPLNKKFLLTDKQRFFFFYLKSG